MYSGDSLGVIRHWNVFTTEAPSKSGVLKDWSLNREILDGEIKVRYQDKIGEKLRVNNMGINSSSIGLRVKGEILR